MKSTLYILCGLPGSGKSTWAKQKKESDDHKTVIVNRDSIRTMIHGVYKYDKEYEDYVRQMSEKFVHSALFVGINVIVDETSIKEYHRKRWFDMVQGLDKKPKIICCHFTQDQSNLQHRMTDPRGLSSDVWSSIIEGMKGDWETPHMGEGFDKIIEYSMYDLLMTGEAVFHEEIKAQK